ncbi:hypothetical protein LBMAG52_04050 [Planctomycetia bacterium]|nr:hypothetical protein LBMAG52_04050 [Planctomycetia bacterium]
MQTERSASSVRWAAPSRSTCATNGGNLKVCNLTETGQKIFERTRLNNHLDTFDSVIDAVASFLNAG